MSIAKVIPFLVFFERSENMFLVRNQSLLIVLGYETLEYHADNNYAQSGQKMVTIAHVVGEK